MRRNFRLLWVTWLLAAIGCGGTTYEQGFAGGEPGSSERSPVGAPKSTEVLLGFQVDQAETQWGESVYLVGETAELGAWDLAQAVRLAPSRYPTWTGLVSFPAGQQIAFKFVVKDDKGGIRWESGENRTLTVPASGKALYVGTWDDTAHGETLPFTSGALSPHTLLGLPDELSTSEPTNSDNYLALKAQYAISYSGTYKTPNWVSWELNTSYLGTFTRQDSYRPDDTLPANIPQAQLSDYKRSGYDRGHMCPSADRTLTALDNDITFYLSNMIPQVAENNRGPWEDLEGYLRFLARNGKQVFIASGGVRSPTASTTIGAGVNVPVATWKVAVVLDHPGMGLADITADTRVIAVLMPNDATQLPDPKWRGYRVSARTIEEQTQLDFLSEVDRSIQDAIETRVDSE